MFNAPAGTRQHRLRLNAPWVQLTLGILCMAMVANLQYGWTLFVGPIDAKYHWGRAAIQVSFTIFVAAETWLIPIKSWLVDKYNPQLVITLGGILAGTAWVLNSFADSLVLFYIGAFIGGAGAAAVYGSCVGNALKWFPRRRGLASGLTAAGFGAGAALTVIPISDMIKGQGYEAAFFYFGIGQAVVILIISLFLRKPSEEAMAAAGRRRTQAQDNTPRQVVTSSTFWVMYLTFLLIASSGVALAAQLAPLARDFGLDQKPVAFLGTSLPALTLALALNRIFDGLGRPGFGWISDRIGREKTMFIAFFIAAVAIFTLDVAGHEPWVFVLSTAVFFMVFGEIYSIFPATSGDTFGATYATTNYGLLYTAKGTASLLVAPLTVMAASLGWHAVFQLWIATAFMAAIVAYFVLRPIRAKFLRTHLVGPGI